MISAKHVDEELPKLAEGKDASLNDIYNALRINAKLLLNIRTNQVVGVSPSRVKYKEDEKKQ